MKTAVALAVVLAALAVSANAQGTCGGSCVGSTTCATGAGDLHCRCTNMACGMIEGNCGGGCLTSAQCAEWAGNDETCACHNLICSRTTDPAPATQYTRMKHFRALLSSPAFRNKFIEANDYAKVAHLAK